MRSTTLITGTLAVVATSSLIGWGTAAYAGEPTTNNERGTVIECGGTINHRVIYASLYENNLAGNTIQIVIGEDDHQVGGSRDTERDFLLANRVFGALKIGGSRAVVEGHAARHGRRTPVHEVHDDAGQHIVVDGFHRQLSKDLTLTWRGRTVPLDCDNAFAYDLQVTKTPIE